MKTMTKKIAISVVACMVLSGSVFGGDNITTMGSLSLEIVEAYQSDYAKVLDKYDSYKWSRDIKNKAVVKGTALESTKKAVTTMNKNLLEMESKINSTSSYKKRANSINESLKPLKKTFDNAGKIFTAMDIADHMINAEERIEGGSTATLEGLIGTLKVVETGIPGIPDLGKIKTAPSDWAREIVDYTIAKKSINHSELTTVENLSNMSNSIVTGESSIYINFSKKINNAKNIKETEKAYSEAKKETLAGIRNLLNQMASLKKEYESEKKSAWLNSTKEKYASYINRLNMQIDLLRNEEANINNGKGYEILVDYVTFLYKQEVKKTIAILVESQKNIVEKQAKINVKEEAEKQVRLNELKAKINVKEEAEKQVRLNELKAKINVKEEAEKQARLNELKAKINVKEEAEKQARLNELKAKINVKKEKVTYNLHEIEMPLVIKYTAAGMNDIMTLPKMESWSYDDYLRDALNSNVIDNTQQLENQRDALNFNVIDNTQQLEDQALQNTSDIPYVGYVTYNSEDKATGNLRYLGGNSFGDTLTEASTGGGDMFNKSNDYNMVDDVVTDVFFNHGENTATETTKEFTIGSADMVPVNIKNLDVSKTFNDGNVLTVKTTDHYNYTAWGEWSQTGGLKTPINEATGIEQMALHNNWIAGQKTENLPNTGSATYSGNVNGNWYQGSVGGTYGGKITGTMNMTVDFANTNVIAGTLNLQKAGGGTFATTTMDQMIINRAESGFAGRLIGAGIITNSTSQNRINGQFNGPNAEEVGGIWNIQKTNNDSASGVFAGKK